LYGILAGLIVMAAAWSSVGKTHYDPRLNTLTAGDKWSSYIGIVAGGALIAYFAWISLGPDRNKPF
jgi:hypothetical protein